jgi:hypothetical protein
MIVRLAAAAATLVLLAACSGAESSAPTQGTAKPASGSSGSSGGTGSSGALGESGSSGSSGTPATDPPVDTTPLPKPTGATACMLPELKAADVSPSFLFYDPPTTQPAAATGGKVDGKYTVDKATVYLPTSTKGLAKPATSTGTVNGWAIFSGTDYRIDLKGDLQVQSIIGVQPQAIAVNDQGTFSAEGTGIKLLTSCSGQAAPAAEVTFSDNGARGTLVIKQTTTRGDTYLVLEAARAE